MLILINGLPATGKTTIGLALAKRLGIAMLSKDAIKEFLWDRLGVGDKEWSTTLGKLSSDFLYDVAGQSLEGGRSLIVESAFWVELARPLWEEVIGKYNPKVLEVYLYADTGLIKDRFRDRAVTGNRHPGHLGPEGYTKTSDAELVARYAPLRVGDLYEVDTTQIDDERVTEIAEEVAKRLGV